MNYKLKRKCKTCQGTGKVEYGDFTTFEIDFREAEDAHAYSHLTGENDHFLCERFGQGRAKIEVVGWYWQGLGQHQCKPQGPFDTEAEAIWEAQT